MPVKVETPLTVNDVAPIPPLTVRVLVGFVVPIPTKPLEVAVSVLPSL